MRNPVLCAALAVCAGISLLALPVRAADKWIEVRSPNFIVVSNGSDGDARKVAVQFEQIRQLFRDSLPYARNQASPVITILAAKDENTLRELLPEYWEKGHAHPAGIFLDAYDQFQVAIDLEARGDNPYETLYHEYYHSLTTPYFPSLPVWLAEGLADFFGNTEINGANATMGEPNVALISELRSQKLLPLTALFDVTRDSPYYNEQNKVSIFYAESWALTHYLMVGDRQSHRAEFDKFLTALDKGETQQQAAKEAFGDIGKLQADLERYIRGTSFISLLAPAPARMDPKALQARALSEAESAAYRGGFLTLHRQYMDAQTLLEQAARTDPKVALAQENLGILRSAQNQPKDALAAFSAAIDLDPKNAYTRYFRAKLSFAGAGVTARNPELESDLRQAISVDANFAPPYSLLALYLASNGDHLDEAADLAQKSVTMQPGRLDYQFILAEVQVRQRKYDQAEISARRILLETIVPSEQSQVNDLLRSIGQQRQYEAQMEQRQREADEAAAARRAEAEQRVAATAAATAAAQDADAPARDSARTESTQTIAPPSAPADSRIRGVATAVVCMGNAMQVTVETDHGAVTLHSRDASKVEYTAYVRVSAGRISPCDNVKGRTVRITTKDGTPAGEITALDIMK